MPRLHASAIPIALAVLLSAAVGAQDFPKLKPGLWTSTTTTSVAGRTNPPQQPSMLCLDDSVQQDM